MRRAPSPTVEVTEEIISTAVERDSGYCMIAEAIRVAVPFCSSPNADLQTIRFSDPVRRQRYIYLTPRVVQQAIVDFDQGVKPEPFSFKLRGAQIVPMQHKGSSPPKTPEQKAKNAQEVAESKKRRMARMEFRERREGGPKPGSIPEIEGGTPPPVAPLSRRRTFGLRALRY